MPRRFVYAVAIAAAIAASAVLLSYSRDCAFLMRTHGIETISGHRPLRGEQQLLPDGTSVYFNGACWTSTPQPPRDMAL